VVTDLCPWVIELINPHPSAGELAIAGLDFGLPAVSPYEKYALAAYAARSNLQSGKILRE
jgi:hypothetical protein